MVLTVLLQQLSATVQTENDVSESWENSPGELVSTDMVTSFHVHVATATRREAEVMLVIRLNRNARRKNF